MELLSTGLQFFVLGGCVSAVLALVFWDKISRDTAARLARGSNLASLFVVPFVASSTLLTLAIGAVT